MIHIDPAHPAFENLPREQQARIYYFNIGWDVTAIADEYDVTRKTVAYWLHDEVRQKRLAQKKLEREAKKAGRTGHGGSRPRHDYARIHQLADEGKNGTEIGAILGIPKASAYRIVAEYRASRQEEAA